MIDPVFKRTPFQKIVIGFPIIVAVIYFFYILISTLIFEVPLTYGAKSLLDSGFGSFLFGSFLIFIPNAILSYLLFLYSSYHKNEPVKLIFLCLISVLMGLWGISVIYNFFYHMKTVDLSVIIYGLPFTYLFGVILGWLSGIAIIHIVKFFRSS